MVNPTYERKKSDFLFGEKKYTIKINKLKTKKYHVDYNDCCFFFFKQSSFHFFTGRNEKIGQLK
jgi:lipopolysaccharide assembly outer membrane protein LptD (OstA)